MIAVRWCASLTCLLLLGSMGVVRAQTPDDTAAVEREARHATPEWQEIAAHLPDPQTGSPQKLEEAADVLRARRMPEDALDFYRYALTRGGNEARLINSIGVTLLELQRFQEARIAFRRAVQLKPKDARNWNNLGAAEYVGNNFRAALDDYLHAVKLDKKTAVFHANLGTAYFELRDFESARQQFEKAVKLDPAVFQSGGGWAGVEAHVLTATDHGRFCFEMAKMAARQHDDSGVIRWLARSSEAGYEVKEEMDRDKDFDAYRKDPRVAMVLRNAKAMRSGQIADSGFVPPIPGKTP